VPWRKSGSVINFKSLSIGHGIMIVLQFRECNRNYKYSNQYLIVSLTQLCFYLIAASFDPNINHPQTKKVYNH